MDKIIKLLHKKGFKIKVQLVDNVSTATTSVPYARWNIVCADEKLKARIKKYEDAAYAKAIAEIEKQRWRPSISYHTSDHSLAWWSLGEPDFNMDRKEYHRYVRNWVGITVSNISKFEYKSISQFLGKFKKIEMFNIIYNDEDIEITTNVSSLDADNIDAWHWQISGVSSMSVWFKEVDSHDKFVEVLKQFIPRDTEIKLGPMADIAAIEHLLSDQNYLFKAANADEISGSVSFTDDDQRSVLVKMFAG